MFVITHNDMVIAISTIAIKTEYGNIKTDSFMIGIKDVDIYKVEKVPEGVEPHTHCYTPEDGFYPYVPPKPEPPSEIEVLSDYIVDVDYRVTMVELGL